MRIQIVHEVCLNNSRWGSRNRSLQWTELPVCDPEPFATMDGIAGVAAGTVRYNGRHYPSCNLGGLTVNLNTATTHVFIVFYGTQ
jgi:hypothetical protein